MNRQMPKPQSESGVSIVDKVKESVMPSAPSVKEEVEVEAPVNQSKASSGIEVVALREGFFNSRRIKEGQVFMVSSESKLGSWMKCTNPEAQKVHAKKMKDKLSSKKIARVGE